MWRALVFMALALAAVVQADNLAQLLKARLRATAAPTPYCYPERHICDYSDGTYCWCVRPACPRTRACARADARGTATQRQPEVLALAWLTRPNAANR